MFIGGIDLRLRPYGGAIVPSSTLLDGLVSYWTLNEESGTRNAAVGGNHLTDNNTVGYDTGVNGNAASLVAGNSEYLSGGKTDISGDVTISAWIYRTSSVGYSPLFVNTWGNTRQTELFASAAATGVYACIHTDGTSQEYSISADWSPSAWSHFVMTYSHSVDRKIRLYKNDSLLGTSNATTGNVINSQAATYIGGWVYGYTDGLIDEVAVWNRVLLDDERTDLETKFWPFT